MLPDTRAMRIFSRAFALCFQAVAPLSIAYCTYCILSINGGTGSRRLPVVLECWIIAEAMFYLVVFLPMSRSVHGPAMELAVTNRAERHELFSKCITTIADPVRYVSLWHRGAPIESIGRENVKEWICWAFMNKSDWGPDEDEELDEYTNLLESLFPDGLKFREGRNPAVQTLRFSLDPVNLTHKPLLFYIFGVGGADIYAALVMWYNGYQHFATKTWFSSFPFRPQTLLSPHRSPAKHISYWYRPHTSKTKLPILYIHGIGILHTYGDFFAELATATSPHAPEDGQIGIIVLELLPISFRITHAALHPSDTRHEIQSILDAHNWTRFILLANSYGTVVSTHLLRSPTLNARTAAVLFIDPVTFLLHLPDMAYNFTRRPPRSASEHQLEYFASTDLGAAHTLARRFSWTDSILWREDLDLDLDLDLHSVSHGGNDLLHGDSDSNSDSDSDNLAHPGRRRRWTILLSANDIIVAADRIGAYLTRPPNLTAVTDTRPASAWQTTRWTAGALDVLWLDGLNHAEVFDTARDRKMVIDIALEYAGAGRGRESGSKSESKGKSKGKRKSKEKTKGKGIGVGVGVRPPGYGAWLQKRLLYKASPARFASTFGLDRTLEWGMAQEPGQIVTAWSGSGASLEKKHRA